MIYSKDDGLRSLIRAFCVFYLSYITKRQSRSYFYTTGVFSERWNNKSSVYDPFLVPTWCTFLLFRDCLSKIYTFTILSRKLSHKGYEKPEIGTGNFIKHSTAPIMKLLIQLQRHNKIAGMFLSCFANSELPTVQLTSQETYTIANQLFTFHVFVLLYILLGSRPPLQRGVTTTGIIVALYVYLAYLCVLLLLYLNFHQSICLEVSSDLGTWVRPRFLYLS